MKPDHIGKYEIVGKIGQGAMGEVFLGQDPVLNRKVAIKRISAGLDADETLKKRFTREAQSAAHLSHPNIITVYELGFEGEQLFMAMELLDGVDLKHALAQRKMSLDEKLGIMEQICEGLAFAHAQEIVHRDLKPANIHILPSGRVKIMDFGLARLSGSEMTTTGMVMGTPHYMSPEQVRGARADARSDIFALGCLFYEMLTGRKPFDAESMHAVLYKVMQEDPPPARELAPAIPEVLFQVVDQTLAKNPAERFQNATDLLVALRRARQAMAAGRGHERAPDLERTPATREAGRPAARSERSHPASSRHTGHPTATAGKGLWLAAGLALGLAILAGSAWVVSTFVFGRSASPGESPQVQSLAQAVIDSQVELALRRLDASDFADAARQAERALQLDPKNARALQVQTEAHAALKRIEEGIAAVQVARAAGGGDRLAAAALELMKLAPGHPEAEKAAAEAGASFRSRVDEARALGRQARRAAEEAGAGGRPAFADGVGLDQQAERAQREGQAVVAARRFLEARNAFERARREGR